MTDDPQFTTVGPDKFRQAIDPFSSMLRELAAAGYTATQAVTPESVPRLAAENSQAMDDLTVEGRYKGEWDTTPVATATSHIALLLTAGEDAMLTFADAILADRTPVYAYVPLARSGLECLALAQWLADPSIETRERVRRSLNERIQSAYEQKSLPDALNPEPGRIERLRRATTLGYQLTPSKKGSRRYFAPVPPTITQHVKRVLGHDRLGKVLYSFASAVSHGALWGLSERVELVEDDPTSPLVKGAITVTSMSIGSMASALAIAHSRSFGAYVTYMGWEVNTWRTAQQQAMRTIGSFLGDRSARPEVETEWRHATPGGLWLPDPPPAPG